MGQVMNTEISTEVSKATADLIAANSFSKEAEARLTGCIAKMIVHSPIYGVVFLYLAKKQVRDMPTMGVGIINRVSLALYYNPEFVMSLTHSELDAVLRHEALHILLHHLIRSSHYDLNKKGYNYAADLAINCHLSGLPDREDIKPLYPKNFQLPDFEASEWYYEKLKQEAEKRGPGPGGLDWSNGRGETIDSHDGWGEGEEEIIKEKIRGIADKAIKAQDAEGWSRIGSNVAKSIIDANKPIINWKREVRYFINKLILAGKKTTRTRINRREQSSKMQRDPKFRDVYLQPGNKKDYTSKLLVAIDTSGSVSDFEVQAFLGEINGMCDHVEVHVTMFDTQILVDPPIPIKKKFTQFDIKGRGGTDFQPIITYVDQHKYDGLVVFTDGQCPYPEKPRARVLWAISPSGDGITPPYGKRVRVEIKQT